jgi:predicted GNAT superfamily acetyltransferase
VIAGFVCKERSMGATFGLSGNRKGRLDWHAHVSKHRITKKVRKKGITIMMPPRLELSAAGGGQGSVV